jgi:transcription elongation factor Elf1
MNEAVELLIPLENNMRIFCPHCKSLHHVYVSQKMIAVPTVIECDNCKDFFSLRFTRHVKPMTVFDANTENKE